MEEQHFYIDSRQVTPTINEDPITTENTSLQDHDTSHLISTAKLNGVESVADAWYQAGFVLTTAVNSAFALGYSGIIMVPLGWIGGTAGLIGVALISLYANHLLARLHETGGKRHFRYRDLAGHIYGKGMYYVTWTLQYINLFMFNIGFIILAGQALKAIYITYNNESPLKLPYCTSMAGLACFIFAFSIPHLSALKFWLGISAFLSLIYITVSIVLSIKDGYSNPRRDYGIPGSMTTQIFTSIGAVASLCFTCNTGMLPEIQATVRRPYVKNIQKALFLQFTAGVVPYYTLTFVGYWAYGSSTSSYLLNNVHGSKWVKTLANAAAFLQTVITLHIFASPAYECLDTKFGRKNESIYSVRNWSVRLVGRGAYLGFSTFVAALLPFLGDFMNLTGAVSLIPLTFVLANHMYIKVKGSDLSALQRSWHWANVWVFSFLAAGASVSAFHQIAVDSKTYHVFADL